MSEYITLIIAMYVVGLISHLHFYKKGLDGWRRYTCAILWPFTCIIIAGIDATCDAVINNIKDKTNDK